MSSVAHMNAIAFALHFTKRLEADDIQPHEWLSFVQMDATMVLPWVPTELRSPELYIAGLNFSRCITLHFPTYESFVKKRPSTKYVSPLYTTNQCGTRRVVDDKDNTKITYVPIYEYTITTT